jgi:dynein heavy chain 1
MEVVSPGVSNGLAASSPLPLADPSVVVQHLTEVLQVTLGALKKDLESAGSLLSKAKYSETVQRCTRFASEAQVALYAQKELVGAEQPNGADEGSRMYNLEEK